MVDEDELEARLNDMTVKVEVMDSPDMFSLSPLTSIGSDMGSPPGLILDLPTESPSKSSSLSSSPTLTSLSLPEEFKFSIDPQLLETREYTV